MKLDTIFNQDCLVGLKEFPDERFRHNPYFANKTCHCMSWYFML